MFNIAPAYYHITYIITASILVLGYVFYMLSLNNYTFLKDKKTTFHIIIYLIFITLLLGLRSTDDAFGDTRTYSDIYYSMQHHQFYMKNVTEDRFFFLFMQYCSKYISASNFFLLVEILYIGLTFLACYRLNRVNATFMMLFVISAFSFYSYGVNGIRNGLAASFCILALSFLDGNIKNKIICFLLCFISWNTHHSMALPILCILAAYFVRNKNIMFVVWISSIVVSLLFGSFFENIFMSLGFDDRLNLYIIAGREGKLDKLFASTGFRWDFLLYSTMPVLLGYYLIIKKGIYDKTFLILLGTYIYANSFWILVIRAAYSNRFAYLSWFLYPIVLSYPLLKYQIWKHNQSSKVALILFAHLLFLIMISRTPTLNL